MQFPPHFWTMCQYRLRKVMAKEDIAGDESWSRHWHPFWVIDVWTNARGWIRVRGKTYQRGLNSVAIYPPRVVYEEKCEAGSLRAQAWVLLEETTGSFSLLQKLTGAARCAVIADPAARVRKSIEEMFEVASTDSPGRPQLLSGHVNHVIGILLNLSADSLPSDESETKLHKQWVHPWKRTARIELERAFPKALTVQGLASALNVAPSTLTHKYKALCGESFKETVQHWRLDKALVLLRNKNISIKEIAMKLGMSQPSYLTAFLKRTTGHSPSELRKMLRQQD